MGAWPNPYKKRVTDPRVRAILEILLNLRFETLVNVEFIFAFIYEIILAPFTKYAASRFTKDYIYSPLNSEEFILFIWRINKKSNLLNFNYL